MKRRNLLMIVMLLLSVNVKAQNQKINPLENAPYIEVTGYAEQLIIPDEIYIEISLRERYENREKITIDQLVNQLRESLLSIGIDIHNMSLTDAYADYVRIHWYRKDVLAGKNIVVKVPDAATVASVFMQLEKLEMYNAEISRVACSKIDSLKKEVKMRAIRNATEKCDYLLSTIGQSKGRPLIIDETETPVLKTKENADGVTLRGSSGNAYYYADGVKMSSAKLSGAIEFQKIKVQSTIYARYAIKE
jgi:uncharacterized protein